MRRKKIGKYKDTLQAIRNDAGEFSVASAISGKEIAANTRIVWITKDVGAMQLFIAMHKGEIEKELQRKKAKRAHGSVVAEDLILPYTQEEIFRGSLPKAISIMNEKGFFEFCHAIQETLYPLHSTGGPLQKFNGCIQRLKKEISIRETKEKTADPRKLPGELINYSKPLVLSHRL